MTSYHCEYAWLGGADASADVVIEVTGDRITDVRGGVPAPPGATRLRGLTLPGFADAHSHAFHRALRGRTHGGAGSFWTWREQMYAVAGRLDPDSYFALARATFAEMAQAGIACVGEFHYVHHQPDGTPYADPNAMGAALCAAAGEAGIRITLLDACYLHGGVGGAPLGPAQLRFGDGSVAAWAERAERRQAGAHVRLGAAIHSVRAVDPDGIHAVAAWAAARDMPLHAHVSEQPGENAACNERYGVTPTELLHHGRALSERFTAVHATHAAAGDITLLGAAGATACFCPTTERDLADGLGPARDLLDAGAALCVGSDSHAVIDVLEETRALELHERMRTNVRGRLGVPDLLVAATEAGHRALGWPEAGRLAPGALADLVTVDLASVRTAGGADPLATAVFAATAADVRSVIVGGVPIPQIDVVGALTDAIARLTGGTP